MDVSFTRNAAEASNRVMRNHLTRVWNARLETGTRMPLILILVILLVLAGGGGYYMGPGVGYYGGGGLSIILLIIILFLLFGRGRNRV
jgi:hypothetical protein